VEVSHAIHTSEAFVSHPNDDHELHPKPRLDLWEVAIWDCLDGSVLQLLRAGGPRSLDIDAPPRKMQAPAGHTLSGLSFTRAGEFLALRGIVAAMSASTNAGRLLMPAACPGSRRPILETRGRCPHREAGNSAWTRKS